MKFSKFILIIPALFFLYFISAPIPIANAAEFRFAEKSGNISIDSEEVLRNLYAAGNIVSINGFIEKDLYAAGNVININGDVEDNIIALGSSIIIKGNAGGNVHIAGGSVVIDGDIDDDLVIAGGNISVSKSAQIKGDLIIAGGMISIDGEILGNIFIAGEDIILNGKTSGLVETESRKLTIGESAEIKKRLKYTSPEEAEIDENAKISADIDFIQKDKIIFGGKYEKNWLLRFISAFYLISIVIAITTGLVLVYFYRKEIEFILNMTFEQGWKNLGIGFATFFLIPILAIILAITLLGLYLSCLLMMLYALLIIVSKIIASILLGSWIIKTIKKKDNYSATWQEVVVGVIALVIVSFIPLIGWLIVFALSLLSLGSITNIIYKLHQNR